MRRPLPEPTAEQLALAFRHLWRPGRPGSVEAMLASPTWAICLRNAAQTMNRPANRSSGQRVPTTPHAPPVPPVPADPTRRWRGPTFDARRAAAGDLDD